jgi:hypothetical protein
MQMLRSPLVKKSEEAFAIFALVESEPRFANHSTNQTYAAAANLIQYSTQIHIVRRRKIDKTFTAA